MNIVLIGSEGQDTLESNTKEVFIELGHNVLVINFFPGSFLMRSKFFMRLSRIVLKIAYFQYLNERRIVRKFRKLDADLVIVFTYASNFITSKTIKGIRINAKHVCAWFVDASVNFLPGRLILGEYDRLYFADLGLCNSIKEYSLSPVSYLPEGHHPLRHRIPKVISSVNKIAIVGTLYSSRVVQIEKLIEIGFEFDFYGGHDNDLIEKNFARASDFRERIYYEEKSQVFANALCVLNLPHPSAWNSINCRVFEVLASGGILVTPRNEAIQQLLVDRRHAFLYSDFDELIEILAVIKTNNFDRLKMIRNMEKLATANSLKSRVATILNNI